MTEYIEREAAIQELIHGDWLEKFMAGKCTVREMFEAIPAADVQLVKRGKWISPSANSDFTNRGFFSDCSSCGFTSMDETNFCPNCGADMREVDPC